MNTTICINQQYSTTRLLTAQQSAFEINAGFAFESILLLSKSEGRMGEGGLRTKGYFKTRLSGMPIITLVTVVFNCVKSIENTILSVIDQTYSNVEYIIIDGGSTDGTLDIIRQYNHAIDYWVSEPDKGIYDAMNKAIALACGDWLIFIGADDKLVSSYVLDYCVPLLKIKDAIYYGDVVFLQSGSVYGGKFNKYKLMQQNFCHQSMLYPMTIYKRKHYDLNYKYLADYKYNIELMGKDVRFIYLRKIICIFNAEGASSVGDVKFADNKQHIIRNEMGFFYGVIKIIRTLIVRILKD